MENKFATAILVGGKGTRLWPLSTENIPKPFVELGPLGRLYEKTAERALSLNSSGVEAVGVSCFEKLCLYPEIGFLEEPAARNTAPAVVLAALSAARKLGSKGGLFVMPADHYIRDTLAFKETVERLAKLCHRESALGVIGIKANEPSSAYGYVKPGEAVEYGYRLESFVEKPDRKDAEILIEEGASWNSGMFYFPLDVFLSEAGKYCSDCIEAADSWLRDGNESAYKNLRGLSIDYALMEKSSRVMMVEADFDWSDVGTYPSLHALLPGDESGNTGWGAGRVEDCRNCLVVAERENTIVKGFDSTVVVETSDGLLVVSMEESDGIRDSVESVIDRAAGKNSESATCKERK